jgi:hypothetical protein
MSTEAERRDLPPLWIVPIIWWFPALMLYLNFASLATRSDWRTGVAIAISFTLATAITAIVVVVRIVKEATDA